MHHGINIKLQHFFSAISLLMLAITNRFLALAQLGTNPARRIQSEAFGGYSGTNKGPSSKAPFDTEYADFGNY